MVVNGDDYDHYFLVKKQHQGEKIDLCWGNLSLES